MNDVVITGFVQDQIHKVLWANDEHFGGKVPRISKGEDSGLAGRVVGRFRTNKINVAAELLQAIGIMRDSACDAIDLRSNILRNEQYAKRWDCLLAVDMNLDQAGAAHISFNEADRFETN